MQLSASHDGDVIYLDGKRSGLDEHLQFLLNSAYSINFVGLGFSGVVSLVPPRAANYLITSWRELLHSQTSSLEKIRVLIFKHLYINR